jgi:hypothetical protein
MKNPNARPLKKSAQASRTITKQSAMSDINRGLDSMNLITSDLEAHEIPELKLDFSDGEVFELSDSDSDDQAATIQVASVEAVAVEAVPTATHHFQAAKAAEGIQAMSETTSEDGKEESKEDSKDKPQNRLALPPKPFTIISGFRK